MNKMMMMGVLALLLGACASSDPTAGMATFAGPIWGGPAEQNNASCHETGTGIVACTDTHEGR